MLAALVVATSSVIAAAALLVIAIEVRRLRLGKLRKPLLQYLEEGARAHNARLRDANKSDNLLESLESVAAFAKYGVQTYDGIRRGPGQTQGAPALTDEAPPVAVPPAVPPSGVKEFMEAPAIRTTGPTPDGTSASS